jgi:beta-exotoxin I transport system permease protein
MTVMLRKALWDLRWTAFWFAAGAAGYTFMVAMFYPVVRDQSEQLAELMANYPKGVLAAIGYTDITTFTGFLGAESLNLFWAIIVTAFATLAGASLVAREVEDGTSEIWLSIPAPRWKLLLGKMAALAVAVLGIVAAGVIVVPLAAVLVDARVSWAGLAAMAVVMAVFVSVVAAYSGLLSSLFSSRGLAAGIAFGITLGSYVLWLVGGLADQWKQLKSISIFTAYTPQKALESGSIDLLPIGILTAMTLLCVVAALFIFQRRDAI